MALYMGLIGAGIRQSRMPRLQEYLGQLAGIDIRYDIIDGADDPDFDPVAQVNKAQAAGYTGLNITHPYKSRIVNRVTRPYVADHGSIGSYNTIKFEHDDLLGANTDFSGFLRAYTLCRGDEPPGSICLVGAGGVGKAIAFALVKLGCRAITLHDHVPAQADALAAVLSQQGVDARAVDQDALADAIRSADALVNCTEMGMHHHPGSAIDLALIGGQTWAFDAVYTPLATAFMTRCREQGLQCMTGYDLWINQGLDAFRIFTGVALAADEHLLNTTRSWLQQTD